MVRACAVAALSLLGNSMLILPSWLHLATWDCIVTCYFIDTAHNIIEYIEVIRRLLKPGGRWINYGACSLCMSLFTGGVLTCAVTALASSLGPLLYHWEGTPGERSIELSLDEVMRVIRASGFTVHDEKTLTATYAANPRSMLKNAYECAFFVAQPAEDAHP